MNCREQAKIILLFLSAFSAVLCIDFTWISSPYQLCKTLRAALSSNQPPSTIVLGELRGAEMTNELKALSRVSLIKKTSEELFNLRGANFSLRSNPPPVARSSKSHAWKEIKSFLLWIHKIIIPAVGRVSHIFCARARARSVYRKR